MALVKLVKAFLYPQYTNSNLGTIFYCKIVRNEHSHKKEARVGLYLMQRYDHTNFSSLVRFINSKSGTGTGTGICISNLSNVTGCVVEIGKPLQDAIQVDGERLSGLILAQL